MPPLCLVGLWQRQQRDSSRGRALSARLSLPEAAAPVGRTSDRSASTPPISPSTRPPARRPGSRHRRRALLVRRCTKRTENMDQPSWKVRGILGWDREDSVAESTRRVFPEAGAHPIHWGGTHAGGAGILSGVTEN